MKVGRKEKKRLHWIDSRLQKTLPDDLIVEKAQVEPEQILTEKPVEDSLTIPGLGLPTNLENIRG